MEHSEIDRLPWRKSSRSSGTGQCVEVAVTLDVVAVRDTKDRARAVLLLSSSVWNRFLAGARNGEFNLPDEAGSSPG